MKRSKDLALDEQEGKTVSKKVTKTVTTKNFILLTPEYRDELIQVFAKLPTEIGARHYISLSQAKIQEITISDGQPTNPEA